MSLLLKITKKSKLYAYRRYNTPRFSMYAKDRKTGERKLHRGYHEKFPFIRFLYWDVVLWTKKPKKDMPKMSEVGKDNVSQETIQEETTV